MRYCIISYASLRCFSYSHCTMSAKRALYNVNNVCHSFCYSTHNYRYFYVMHFYHNKIHSRSFCYMCLILCHSSYYHFMMCYYASCKAVYSRKRTKRYERYEQIGESSPHFTYIFGLFLAVLQLLISSTYLKFYLLL